MAHRATLTVTVGGLNIVNFIGQRYKLQEMLIASQARTDPLPPPGNYGDVLFEIVSKDTTLALLQKVLRIRELGRAVEANAIVDTVGELKARYSKFYDEAIDKSQTILELRGWELHELVDNMKRGRQSTPLDYALADDLDDSLAIQQGGPSQFGDLPQIYLATSKTEADRAPTLLLNRDRVLESSDQLAEASSQPTTKSSAE